MPSFSFSRWSLHIALLLSLCCIELISAHFVSRSGKQAVIYEDDRSKPENLIHSEQKRVAIIGAGAAGASTAWHLEKYAAIEGLNLSITVFEKNPRPGGRARTVNAWDDPLQPIELGASLFVEVNQILVGAMNELHLAPRENQDHDENTLIGIWDGEQFVFTQRNNEWGWWSSTKILWKYGWNPIRTQRLMKKTIGNFIKMYDVPFFPFKSLTTRIHDLGLAEITAVTGSQYLTNNGVSGPFVDHIIQASTRVNYGQNIGVIHGLESMVCMAIEGAMQIEGGNWQIFQRMLHTSGATLRLNTSVQNISKKDGRFFVDLKNPIPDASGATQLLKHTSYDTVVIASPLQFADLKISDGIVQTLPKSIPYVTLHTTLFATPLKLNGHFFGLDSDHPMPDTVITTLSPDEDNTDRENMVGKAGFFSISTLRSAMNPTTKRREYVYKIFSPTAVSSQFIAKIFNITSNDMTTVPITNPELISWWYPYAWQSYPYEFPRVTFDDPVLGRNIYYTSGIEPFISTMETSALMGKNVARLIVDEYLEL